jgi:peptidoglycan/LPS O-acetylase OafA/YrhL
MATEASSGRVYLPFIDWMKCTGITLIVVGHVAAAPFNHLTPPIFPKQLGVAFFMFVMGFSLSRETRRPLEVLFNRLFEIYLFGIAIAVLMSAIMLATKGTPNLSNYLPFVLGVNVLFDNFPANPTTWYIGTYLHMLVLWAVVVRRLRVRPWMLALVVLLEVGLRALLLAEAGNYIAYMTVPNWMTVFLVGTWFGQETGKSPTQPAAGLDGGAGWRTAAYLGVLAGWSVAWALAVLPEVREFTFPFMRLSAAGKMADALASSIAATVVYLVYTLLFFQVVRSTRTPGWVRFIARNTIIIFIAHMPVYYAVADAVRRFAPSYLPRAVILVSICLFGLALVSEVARRVIQPESARRHLAMTLGLVRSSK